MVQRIELILTPSIVVDNIVRMSLLPEDYHKYIYTAHTDCCCARWIFWYDSSSASSGVPKRRATRTAAATGELLLLRQQPQQ